MSERENAAEKLKYELKESCTSVLLSATERWYREDELIETLLDIINTTAATAWSQGETTGRSRTMRMMSDEPSLPPATNPYTSS